MLLNQKQLKICFVNPLLPNLSKDWNLPYLIFAEWLAQAGHSVSILSLPSHIVNHPSIHWQKSGKTSLQFISIDHQEPAVSSLLPAVHSYHVLQWMLNHASDFDLVHFPLTGGLGYYTLLAKHQGWAFQQMKFCVEMDSPTLWNRYIDKQWIDQIDDLAADFFERECVRLADFLVCQDSDVLNWMKKENWQYSQPLHTLSDLHSFKDSCSLKDCMQAEWLRLHEKIRDTKFSRSQTVSKKTDQPPFVSICVTHFNRPHYLAQVLESIRAQDYPHFEVILVDDASTLPEAHRYLESLAPEFAAKGWKIIRNQKNLFPGAARNLAARQSRGEYLLFMDDDNYAKSHQISTFVQVARHVGADILTCAMDVFGGQGAPSSHTPLIHRFLPLGSAVTLGLYLNVFGDMNALIRKETYEALNGLTEEHGVGGEDWELFSRAVLKGYHLETIPLALFWYRDTPRSITKTTQTHENYLRGIRSYLDVVPFPLRGNIILAQAQQEKLHKLMQEHQSLGKLLKRCWQLFSSRASRIIRHPRRSARKIAALLSNFWDNSNTRNFH